MKWKNQIRLALPVMEQFSCILYLHTHVFVGGKRVTAKEEIQSIHWATWTGVLGSEVNGIWPKYTQVNDINATDASFDHQTIVTGDDFGLVKLFRFPCVKKGLCWMKNQYMYL